MHRAKGDRLVRASVLPANTGTCTPIFVWGEYFIRSTKTPIAMRDECYVKSGVGLVRDILQFCVVTLPIVVPISKRNLNCQII